MIEHQEAWQVFSERGEPLVGKSILPTESRKTSDVIVGAVHIWIWRRTNDGIKILLQKRAVNKPTWPDYLDISVAGHIDAGESQTDAIIRESQEEVGFTPDIENLEYIFSYRNFENGLKWIYLYELTEDTEFIFNDGEVQSLDWVSLGDFIEKSTYPEKHNLVPHSQEYYGFVVKALKRFE